jgi:hypothetical protein
MKTNFDKLRKNISAAYNELVKYISHMRELQTDRRYFKVNENDLNTLLNDLNNELAGLNAIYSNNPKDEITDLSDIIKLERFLENE